MILIFTVCMAVPDDFDFYYWGLYTCTRISLYTCFVLTRTTREPSFYLGNVDPFSGPKMRQLHSPGGVSTVKIIFSPLF
jgi:hypothetical protein